MKCIIVDNEDMARRSLSHLCEKIEGVEVLATCKSAKQVLSLLRRESVDVVLASTSTSDLDNLSEAQELPRPPQVILITRREAPNQKIFDQSATEFLTYPVSKPRLARAFDRVRRRDRMLHRKETPPEQTLRIHDGKTRVLYRDIVWIEDVDTHVVIHTFGEQYEAEFTLREIAEILSESHFLKVNRSHVINLKEVQEVGETNILLPGKEITISRAKRPVVMRHLNLL